MAQVRRGQGFHRKVTKDLCVPARPESWGGGGGGPRGYPGPRPQHPRPGVFRRKLPQSPGGVGGGLQDGLLTVLLGRLIVFLAHQPPILQEVELVTRGQLPAADDAGEAMQVVHEVLRLADHLGRGDALLARRAFRAEAPGRAAQEGEGEGEEWASVSSLIPHSRA